MYQQYLLDAQYVRSRLKLDEFSYYLARRTLSMQTRRFHESTKCIIVLKMSGRSCRCGHILCKLVRTKLCMQKKMTFFNLRYILVLYWFVDKNWCDGKRVSYIFLFSRGGFQAGIVRSTIYQDQKESPRPLKLYLTYFVCFLWVCLVAGLCWPVIDIIILV